MDDKFNHVESREQRHDEFRPTQNHMMDIDITSQQPTHLDDPFRNNSNNKYLNQFNSERTTSNKRLIITKIILENFKSYHGKTEIGPFHKSFTSIVGPNGSGKSNLIESLLFIFGKRAKWMRLNKLNELIHNSAKYSNFTKASVEVHFQEIADKDDPDNFELIEGTQFSLKRSVNISNISKYEINDQDASQIEVITLLKSKGIDLDNNRFLILQGEVEQISMMKPKSGDPNDPGLLEYLEDIIGSSKYKEQIDSLEIEFDKLIDIKQERVDRVKISEGELLKLDEAKNIAVDFVKKEKQWFQLVNAQYQLEKHRANKIVSKTEDEISTFEIKLKDEKSKLKEKVEENEKFMMEISQLKQEIDTNQKAIKLDQRKFEELSNKDAKIQNNKKHQLANEVKCKHQLELLKKQYQNIIESANEIEEQLPLKEKELTLFTNLKDSEEQNLHEMQFSLRSQTEKYRREREAKEKEMEPYVKKFFDIKNRLDEYENENQIIKRKKKNVQHDVDVLNAKKQEINNIILELEKQHEKAGESLDNMNELTNNSKNKLKELRDKEEELQQEYMEVNSKLEEWKRLSKEMQTRDQILTELLKAQHRKELSGICGRLGDLGTIDEFFDCAITTACPQLDHIVVNRYDEVLKCVEFLRNGKIGRTTFIALDKIDWAKEPMRRYAEVPKNAQRLFDLVQPNKEEYRIAFYFALKETLVCEDLEAAAKIAYGDTRRKIVTVKGDLVDVAGTVSGGGKPKKGGMGNTLREEVSQDLIKKVSERLVEIKKRVEDVKKDRIQAEKELQEAQKDQTTIRKEKQRAAMDIDHNKYQLKDIDKKLEEAAQQLLAREQDEKKQSDLENTIKECKDELEAAKKDLDVFRQELKGIDKKIEEISGKDYKDQVNIVNDLEKKVETVEKEVSKMIAQRHNSVKNLQKNKKEQQEAQERYEKSMSALEKLNKEEKVIEEEGLKILESQKLLIEKKVQLDIKFFELEKENEKSKKILGEQKSWIDKLVIEIDDKKKFLKKAKDEYTRVNTLLEDHRAKYKEIISQYDFLDSLPEIEKYKIGIVDNAQMSNKEAVTAADIQDKKDETLFVMIDIATESSDEIEEPKVMETKKVKVTMDVDSIYTIDVLQDFTISHLEALERFFTEIRFRSNHLSERIKQTQPNINSISEFKFKFIDHKNRLKELNDIRDQINKVKTTIQALKKSRYDEFIRGFNVIGAKLKETYQMLTLGGDAELELIDNLEPFSEGVIFSVRPPKKTWKQMAKLSGGEKTLSSLALVFALHYYKPTPLYFMDEIDAALDYKNVAIVGNYVKEKTKNAQFIIISLRNNMFELADRLVGVYKTFDATKTISINPGKLLRIIQERHAKNHRVEMIQ